MRAASAWLRLQDGGRSGQAESANTANPNQSMTHCEEMTTPWWQSNPKTSQEGGLHYKEERMGNSTSSQLLEADSYYPKQLVKRAMPSPRQSNVQGQGATSEENSWGWQDANITNWVWALISEFWLNMGEEMDRGSHTDAQTSPLCSPGWPQPYSNYLALESPVLDYRYGHHSWLGFLFQ